MSDHGHDDIPLAKVVSRKSRLAEFTAGAGACPACKLMDGMSVADVSQWSRGTPPWCHSGCGWRLAALGPKDKLNEDLAAAAIGAAIVAAITAFWLRL